MADALLVPVQPSPVDIASAEATWLLARDAGRTGLQVRLVLSRAISGTVLGRTAREALAAYGVRIYRSELAQRIAHAEAAAVGQSVLAYEPGGKAVEEVRALAREVWADGGKA